MKIFWIVIFLTFTNYFVQAQNYTREHLDSLYEKFVWLRTDTKNSLYNELIEADPADRKCGFGIVSEIIHNLENFTREQQIVLAKILQRPTKDTSMISPSGFFRIHYDTTGIEAPNYALLDTNSKVNADLNAIQVALAADSSYNFEVNFLEYPPPPPDNNEGGDNLYDIYIIEYGGHYYGATTPESSIGEGKYTNYIMIDNDYLDMSGGKYLYFSLGLNGAKVTVAHELHHAIQVGNYTGDKYNLDGYFYEMTSTSMEEFVYDDINDYYAYMPDYFYNTERTFSENNGYNLAIWNIFLKDKFDIHIIKKQWELLRDFSEMRALNAINASLNLSEYHSNFRDIFHEFGVWTFFTKHRAKQGEYFEEGANYPLVASTTFTFQPPEKKVTIESKPVSNWFISFLNTNSTPDDTIIVLISNGDYITGVNNPSSIVELEYTLYDYNAQGSRKLNENLNYYSLFNAGQIPYLGSSEFLNSELFGINIFTTEYNYAFPSPFKYGVNNFIFIPISSPESDNANLNVYTTSMDLVYSVNQSLNDLNSQPGIIWNALGNNGQRLASGVYIYAIKSGEKPIVGKLVIFNE